ncbi:transcriptional regulator, IclR family [Halogranum amylolyticum]|uniref:Transcriptional regulator, IclR family n=2 Tax=Halogranum amylolyticum TaxID=660520 RepID=A0A1H8UE20_9EURY|nr:transcriptional regulator, IclR family [Halogranum amylolyticum]
MLERIRCERGCDVKEIMEAFELPRSTAHIYLKTLEEMGFVERKDGTYYLGLRSLEYGGYARHQLNVYQIARNMIDELATETQSVATLGCEDDGQRVMLYRTEPVDAVSDNAPTGEYTEMHWTALGKVLLAERTDEEVRTIVDQFGLPRATEHTITDLDELLADLETTRSRGYAIEDEERVVGVRSIAVPIEVTDDLFDNVAISIAGPKPKFESERIESELVPMLKETANVIELKQRHY